MVVLKKQTKQTTYIYILFYDMQAPDLHTMQYCNKDSSHNCEKYKKTKKLLTQRILCIMWEVTHKKNLEHSQKYF